MRSNYRSRGGTGISALLGGFLAAAPLLTLASMLVAGIIGMALQSGMVAMFGGLLLLIPVLAVAKHDWRYPVCLAVCFVLMLVAMSPAAKSMKGAEGASFRSVMRMETVPMGKQFIAMSEKLGFGRKKGQGSS